MDNSMGIMDGTMNIIMEDELDRAVRAVGEEMRKDKTKPDKKKSAQGHRGRVRARFLASGVDGFAPHELLELLLFYAIPQKDTKQIAHKLIERFGSIAGVFDADVSELTKISGITENAAVLFKLVPQLTKVYYAEKNKNIVYNTTSLLTQLFRPCFIGSSTEEFFIACFNNNLNLLEITPVSRGSCAYTSIEMRKIMSEVMKDGCTMAALSHNHPGGEARPSDEDIAVTRRINELLQAVGVKLMDHIIVGESGTYSMRDGGDLGIFD